MQGIKKTSNTIIPLRIDVVLKQQVYALQKLFNGASSVAFLDVT